LHPAAGPPCEAERHLALALPFIETIRQHGGRSFGLRLAGARAYALAGRRDEALEQLGIAARLPETFRRHGLAWSQE
jgi:hypothetical protein